MLPWGVNQVISCGGIVVRPGDIIVGDNDGVVCVPSSMAEKVVEIGTEREKIETVIKMELEKNPQSPGRYYPFNDKTDRLFMTYKKTKNTD